MSELLEVWHEGQTYAMTPHDLIETLTYTNYRANRLRSPQISPERWQRVIPEFTKAMEQRFQEEEPGTHDGWEERCTGLSPVRRHDHPA